MERTQIYLSPGQARALDREARRRGTTRSHLIREAIDQAYGEETRQDSFLEALEVASGGWAGHTETGEEYVDRIRSGDRWRELWGDRFEDAAG